MIIGHIGNIDTIENQLNTVQRILVELKIVAGNKDLITKCSSRLSMSIWNTINDFEVERDDLEYKLNELKTLKESQQTNDR